MVHTELDQAQLMPRLAVISFHLVPSKSSKKKVINSSMNSLKTFCQETAMIMIQLINGLIWKEN